MLRQVDMDGLALFIFVAIVAMIAIPTWLGQRLLRDTKGGRGRWLGAIVGGGLGLCIACATFFEDTWSPPRTITFVTPPAFRYGEVVLIEDPAATTTIAWSGFDAPFVSPSARIPVPPSGIVRIRSLRSFRGHRVDARLSDGRTQLGGGEGPLHPSLGRGTYSVFDFSSWSEDDPGITDGTEEAFAAAVLAREAEN